VPIPRVFGGPTPGERRASQPRRRQHCWAQNATSIHDWWASRVETARISLKHMRRFRLAPRGGQNGARPGFRAIQHGECALGALEGRFCLPGRCVRIGGRAPTQGVHPSAMEVLGARNGQLPLRSRCLPPPYHPLPKTPCVAIGRCRHARPPYLPLYVGWIPPLMNAHSKYTHSLHGWPTSRVSMWHSVPNSVGASGAGHARSKTKGAPTRSSLGERGAVPAG